MTTYRRPRHAVRMALAASVILAAGAALAAELTGAEAAKARMEHMKALGGASKAVTEQLKSGAPDMAVVRLQAARIDDAAKVLPTWFPAGSGPSADPESKSLPVVWTDWSGFQTKAKALTAAAAKFDAVAQGGDAAAVAAAFHDVGATCKDCHDTFRAKDRT